MSAMINSAPSPAAPAAQLAMNIAGAPATAAVPADSGAADSGVASFGALFQQLLGKQAVSAADPLALATLVLPADAATATATEVNPVGALAALMPFLEGLGLIKTETAEAGTDLENPLTTDTAEVDAAALAGIAPALTPQLLTAAAITAARATAGNSVQAEPPALPKGEVGLPLQMASLVAAVNVDNRGSGSATDSGLPTQAASLTAENKTAGQGLELAPKFAAVLEAATDKKVGAANPVNPSDLTPTANPAVLTSHPSGSPLANNSTTVGSALPIDQHVGAPGWSQEVGNRLVWMSNNTNSHAELVLTPPQMGRVEVSLSVTGDQATATFVSSNPVVRETLEAAMPRLREILADAGIQLGQTQVGAENARQSAQQEKNGDNFAFNRDIPAVAGISQSSTTPQPAASGLKMGRGLVDIFA